MELTLRQGRNLESRLRNLTIEGQTIEVRAYDSAVARVDIEAGVQALADEIDTKLELNDIRHFLKNEINVVNMECGVSALLNTRDMLYSKRDVLNTLGVSDTVHRQVAHIASSPKATRIASAYTSELEEDVYTDIISIDSQLNEISRKLNELNNSVTISISDEDVAILKGRNLL